MNPVLLARFVQDQSRYHPLGRDKRSHWPAVAVMSVYLEQSLLVCPLPENVLPLQQLPGNVPALQVHQCRQLENCSEVDNSNRLRERSHLESDQATRPGTHVGQEHNRG